jgi:hypothetical protein
MTEATMVQAPRDDAAQAMFPIVELRQYTLHEGRRDALIDMFERHFIEPQEQLGMKVFGTFRDLDRPNRFVWLRGFRGMESRLDGLTDFYSGPVWQAHRDAANATMIDSDNVMLLRAPNAFSEFAPAPLRPGLHEDREAGLVIAMICYLKSSPLRAAEFFEAQVKPRLVEAGEDLLGWFVTENRPNNFPRLPVREGERVLVWFARYPDMDAYWALADAIDAAAAPLSPLLESMPEILKLVPTARSELR